MTVGVIMKNELKNQSCLLFFQEGTIFISNIMCSLCCCILGFCTVGVLLIMSDEFLR